MNEKIFLLALLPYAFLLIWWLRRWRTTESKLLVLFFITVFVVWAVLYASFCMAIFPQDPASAFASVEYIMRDVDMSWLLRYVAEVYGWSIGVIYFVICLGLARFWERRIG